MGSCNFCQTELDDDKDFQVIAPDKTEARFCPDCMADILNLFKSGKAELMKLNYDEIGDVSKSRLNIHQGRLVEVDSLGKSIKYFPDVEILHMSRKRMSNHSYAYAMMMNQYHNYPQNSGRTIQDVLEFEGRILLD